MTERIAYEQEQELIRLEQAAQAEQERITARATEDGETNNEETGKE